MAAYEPFSQGPLARARRTVLEFDAARGLRFPCEVWEPTDAGIYPLIIFSHHSGGSRGTASYLCDHLSSHGYVVVAMDHSETVDPALARPPQESEQERSARWDALISARVPDVEFLLDRVLRTNGWGGAAQPDPQRIGIAGHSFGGWTALAGAQADPHFAAVAALAPGGSSQRNPGILPLTLSFEGARAVPSLYLAARDDTSLPLAGIREIFDRAPHPKRLVVLSRADHLHFADDVERNHEAVRTMALPPALAGIQQAMRPIADLCSGEQAHRFVCGLTVSHFDAYLKADPAARDFLDGTSMPSLPAAASTGIRSPDRYTIRAAARAAWRQLPPARFGNREAHSS